MKALRIGKFIDKNESMPQTNKYISVLNNFTIILLRTEGKDKIQKVNLLLINLLLSLKDRLKP